MNEAIDILMRLKLEAHFNKELNKEAKIDIVIKALKVIIENERL